MRSEETLPVNGFRKRKMRRKATLLARALTALEEQARVVPPPPRQTSRITLEPR